MLQMFIVTNKQKETSPGLQSVSFVLQCTFWAYQGMLSPLVSVCLYFHALHNCIHDSGDNATVGTMQWLFNNCLLAQSAKDLAIVAQLELMWLA